MNCQEIYKLCVKDNVSQAMTIRFIMLYLSQKNNKNNS